MPLVDNSLIASIIIFKLFKLPKPIIKMLTLYCGEHRLIINIRSNKSKIFEYIDKSNMAGKYYALQDLNDNYYITSYTKRRYPEFIKSYMDIHSHKHISLYGSQEVIGKFIYIFLNKRVFINNIENLLFLEKNGVKKFYIQSISLDLFKTIKNLNYDVKINVSCIKKIIKTNNYKLIDYIIEHFLNKKNNHIFLKYAVKYSNLLLTKRFEFDENSFKCCSCKDIIKFYENRLSAKTILRYAYRKNDLEYIEKYKSKFDIEDINYIVKFLKTENLESFNMQSYENIYIEKIIDIELFILLFLHLFKVKPIKYLMKISLIKSFSIGILLCSEYMDFVDIIILLDKFTYNNFEVIGYILEKSKEKFSNKNSIEYLLLEDYLKSLDDDIFIEKYIK